MVEEEGRRSEPSVRRPIPNGKMPSITFFSDDDIKRATDGFSDSSKIGQGVYGKVYGGYLEGTEVVIKMLDAKSNQNVAEFLQGFLHMTMRHPNFVNLIGVSTKLSCLAYEFLPNGSVEDCLGKNPSILTWQMRTRIIYEMCSTLTFLHSKNLVHGDIRPAKILLDASYSSKLADFGLFGLLPEWTTASAFLAIRSGDTLDYIDPVFLETGILTPACDFYSCGVTILRLLTGKNASQIGTMLRGSREWFMGRGDPTAGEWDFRLAELLSYFGLKCCRKNRKRNPNHMEEIMEDLWKLLHEINNYFLKEKSLQHSMNMIEEEGRRSEPSVRRPTPNEEKSSITFFSEDDIKRATNDLSDFYKIGQGGYGSVYRGYLDYITKVTIKMLDAKSNQGVTEFLQELLHITNDLNNWCKIRQEEVIYRGHSDNREIIGCASFTTLFQLCQTLATCGLQAAVEFFQKKEIPKRQMRQPKLVKLIGVSIKLPFLVYEFLPDGSVEDCLRKNPSILTWQMRTRIIRDLCSTLTFLHSKNLVHGDIRPANILLDASFNGKLADFGLFGLLPEWTTASAFLDTRPEGTLDYIDPEFLETGILTPACDFYSFGVTILRILTGKKAVKIGRRVRDSSECFVWVGDSTAGKWDLHLSVLLSNLGLKCCQKDRKRNPSYHMEEIMKDLGHLSYEIDNILNKEDSKSIRIEETCGTTSDPDTNSYILSSTRTSSVKVFSYLDIERATNGLSESSKIGQGGYGCVYKGYLDNTEVAIKMLDTGGTQGSEEFIQELEVLGQMRHPNLVKLIGACFTHHSLVYEFLPNGSLEDFLKSSPRFLTWQMRIRIVWEICSALIFLHSNKPQSLVHGDLKPANILLDVNFNSKLADFGLCRFLPEGTNTDNFHHTHNIKGTEWYIDPDFLETGKLSPRCDVYSFGVMILRILTGKSPARIVMRVYTANEGKSLMTMVDSTAGPWPNDVAKYLAHIGLRCCDPKRGSSALMLEISSRLKDILDKIYPFYSIEWVDSIKRGRST